MYYLTRIITFLALLNTLGASTALAKEFRYPGQELLGTWRIVRYDMSEFRHPLSRRVLEGLVYQKFYLPPGQLVKIDLDGIYAMAPASERPWLTFTTASPVSAWICQFDRWKDICKNGKVPVKYAREQTYGVEKNKYDGFGSSVVFGFSVKRLLKWPGASSYEFSLAGNADNYNDGYYIRKLKGNRLLVMFVGGKCYDFSCNGKEFFEAKKNREIGTAYSIWKRVSSPDDTSLDDND